MINCFFDLRHVIKAYDDDDDDDNDDGDHDRDQIVKNSKDLLFNQLV